MTHKATGVCLNALVIPETRTTPVQKCNLRPGVGYVKNNDQNVYCTRGLSSACSSFIEQGKDSKGAGRRTMEYPENE